MIRLFTQKQKTIAYRVLMAIYLVALGPNYTFGYATQDNPTNRFFLIANLLSIVALILAAVWIDRPKFFKVVSAMMVIVAILAIVQLVFPGQSAYARYSNAWAIINIIWAVLTVLYQKQQLQMKKHA
ncbi:hypothetical protein ACX3UU_05185 [Lactobacillus delbrueckii]